jgi:xanthine dehydrogenase small subunit
VSVQFTVDGEQVQVDDPHATLLDVLRHQVGITSVKDGCSPQGQCGCCTVLVDGAPRVACVTPARRMAGLEVTTLEGLHPAERERWLAAFTACGASQCGFCTPGIVMRLVGTHQRNQAASVPEAPDDDKPDDDKPDDKVERALAAHLCRCTGWRPIIDAWHLATSDLATSDIDDPRLADGGMAGRSVAAAQQRATLEGHTAQTVGPSVAAGLAGFADDTAPVDALVALPDGDGGWVVADSVTHARQLASKVQGRRTTATAVPPLEVPPGEWTLTLRTSWVEPAYLEADASWCEPGGEPASPVANGGAFGGKTTTPVTGAARILADVHQRPIRVLLDREDTVRLGPKRPPIAAGVRSDGTGVVRVVATPGIADAIHLTAPFFEVESHEIAGPPTAAHLRGAGWVEAAILVAAATGGHTITSPDGATATAGVSADGAVTVGVACGDPLDATTLASYCIGAAHMAIGWVTSESLAVADDGTVGDLTIRSFGVLRAADTPKITVVVDPSLGDTTGPAVPGSDAVFAAVALAVWRHQGFPPCWPTGQPLRSR